MTDLQTYPAGYSVIAQLKNEQSKYRQNFLASLFGLSPLQSEARSWYAGALGEIEVGKILDKLKDEGYLVLHSVPIGKNGSDIDHVILTPSQAVYTINTKAHFGKKIWAAGSTFMVNGHKQPYIRNSQYEAKRVLEKLKFFNVAEVHPLIVVVGAEKVSFKSDIAVPILTPDQLLKSIRLEEDSRQKQRICNEATNVMQYKDLPEDMRKPGFWTNKAPQHPEQKELYGWFYNLKRTVRVRKLTAFCWKFGLFAAATAALFHYYLLMK
jgi:hypothetical protein